MSGAYRLESRPSESNQDSEVPQPSIRRFKEDLPRIVVSVGMLDSGLDRSPIRPVGLFIGYAYEDAKWFLRSCEANLEDFQEFFERFETCGTTYGREVWNEAEAYVRSVPEILSEHRKELEKHVQDEFQRNTVKGDRFKIVSRALKNMIDGSLISKREHKWLRVQQRMSRLYSEKLRKRLRSRTSERLPLIVIDTSRPYFPDKA